MVGWGVRKVVDCEFSVDVDCVFGPDANVHLVANLYLTELAVVGATVVDTEHCGAVLLTVIDAPGWELEKIEGVCRFPVRSVACVEGLGNYLSAVFSAEVVGRESPFGFQTLSSV